jgi:hypothetical protein
MIDPERLQRVATELADAVNAREQGKQVRLPVIQRADAAALTNLMHAQLDEAIARRDAEIGPRMACSKGCNSCCVSPVLITEAEAVAVVEWLRDPAHADVRTRFEVAYPTWRHTLGELAAQSGDPRTPEQTREWCLLVQQRQAMCAFNHEGACSIYPVRPALCRKAHALDTNQHCNNDGAKVQYYQHPETENAYEEQRPMKFALHMALRPNGRLDLLCTAVNRLLGGSAAGRNDPCPCGSGKKYKKCCGA